MSEMLKLIQEADLVAFELETARANIEAAKQNLETAKEAFEQTKKSYEEVLTKADELGVPRPKIRKLMEERTSALVSSGLIQADGVGAVSPKAAKAPKAPKAARKKGTTESGEDRIEFDVEEVSANVM